MSSMTWNASPRVAEIGERPELRRRGIGAHAPSRTDAATTPRFCAHGCIGVARADPLAFAFEIGDLAGNELRLPAATEISRKIAGRS